MSNRIVTGDALSEVLTATKYYIDNDFFEAEPEGTLGGIIQIKPVDDCQVDDYRVDAIISKYFNSNK